jgi:hypothetical protein
MSTIIKPLFHKILGNFLSAKNLLVYQEGFCLMALDS